MTQPLCKRDTKSKSHPSMKLAPVRVFSCKHPLLFFDFSVSTKTRRNHNFKKRPKKTRTNYFKFSFFNRHITDWKNIPSNIRHAPLLFLNRQYACTSFNLVGLLSSLRTADGIFHLCGPTRIIRDLEIRGRDKLRRLPKVNFHNEACAHEAQTSVLAVLVSSRTRLSPFCRRLENVSISRLVFTYNTSRNRFPFQICWPWCFLRSYSSRFLSEIFRNEEKRP